MRLPLVAGFVTTLLATTVSAHLPPRNHDAYDYFALHLDPSVPPERVAQALNARHEGQIGKLADHHTFSVPKGRGLGVDSTLEGLRKRRRRRSVSGDAISELDSRSAGDALDGVMWSQKLSLKPPMQKRPPPPLTPDELGKLKPKSARSRVKASAEAVTKAKSVASTLSIKDPIFLEQWHLYNTYEVGHDLNVTGLWLEGITGEGVISAIVDDGLDMYSKDLKDNYYAEGSYDFNDKSNEPKPRLFDDKHGTRCAGEIAAVKNDVCGVGVAYDSKVAGIRILSKPVTDEDEALAIIYGYEKTDIYSCSWGPVDDGKTMDAPGILIQRAMVEGIQRGRDGKGSIYVFAAGNGASSGDNCNFDGYTNSIYSITVGAVDTDDNHPYYSESCSAQLVVTYSSGGSGSIQTTDVGADTCSTRHGGTSAAGPLVVGVVALAVGVRPELTWRDIQHLMVQTAVPVHEDDGDWQETTIGKKFSHDYGYGKVDAYSLVKLAKEWELVKPQAWIHSPWQLVHHDIPQGDQGLASIYEITEDMLKKNNLERVEHVTVTMNVNHTRRGDLSVELRSPDGIVSHLSVGRKYDDDQSGYVDWTFMSVAHWGESGKGKWTVIVKDATVNEHKGIFVDWQLTLWGEAIDAAKQELHPLPNEHDHDHETESASHVATTDVTPAPTKTPGGNPDDHIDRPVNAKPTGATPAEELSPSPTTTTSTTEPAPSATPSAASESFLPSFFPTFGASKRTQMWIYGSLALILIFCCTLGIYFYIQRRRRLRNNPRDDYEFEMIEEDGAGHHLGGHAGGKKQRKRGGELYDAFAGESDEELLSSEDEDEKESDSDEPYRDEASGSDSVRDEYNEKERRRSREGLSDET